MAFHASGQDSKVRDVHYTHYGRLCPIETPEGPNIGLISSLCVFAKINDLGFISTPYRSASNGKVNLNNEDVAYFTAEEEEGKIIAQANALIDDEGNFINAKVKARLDADYPLANKEDANLMGCWSESNCFNSRIFDYLP